MTDRSDAIALPASPHTGPVTDLCATTQDTDNDYSRLKILIVDDSRFYRTVIINALAPFRLTNVIEARSGAEALEVLRTNEIDFALIDYEMPEMNGAELVRQIRWSDDEKLNAQLPIIMISSFTEKAVVLAARNAGIHEFVGKPIIPTELFKRIRATIDSPREFIVTDDYRGPDRRWIDRSDGAKPHPA
jgi:CheY-like chemotaxis protein